MRHDAVTLHRHVIEVQDFRQTKFFPALELSKPGLCGARTHSFVNN